MADFGDLAGPGITGQIIRRLLQVEGPKTIAQIHKAVKSHYRFLELPSKAPTYKSTERYVKTLVQLGLVRAGARGGRVPVGGLGLHYQLYELVPSTIDSPLWQSPTKARRELLES